MTFGRSVGLKAGSPGRRRAMALGLSACGSSSKTSAPDDGRGRGRRRPRRTTSGGSALKLGFFGALTGANAQLGINIQNGEKLAVAQYNATNPANPVTLDPFDSQGDPSQANNGATKLIGDKVVAVIGPAFSGESAAADPIFEAAQIPNVSASATNVKLAQNGWKFFHRVLADDSLQGPGDADYLVKTVGAKNIAVIDDNSTYGAGLADRLRRPGDQGRGHGRGDRPPRPERPGLRLDRQQGHRVEGHRGVLRRLLRRRRPAHPPVEVGRVHRNVHVR